MTPPAPASNPVLFGDSAVLVPTSNAAQSQSLAVRLRHLLDGQIVCTVPAAETVLVRTPAGEAPHLLASVVQACRETAAESLRSPAQHALSVRYDGEDLSGVANLLDLSVTEVVARHTAAVYTVEFLGFAPGFPYLSGLDPVLSRVPRLDSPRHRIPVGSVGLAAGHTCVYPTASPGGWRLLGSTDTALFDPTNDATPALLQPGDIVTFHEAG